MARYILEVGTNCKDPAREAEYSDWYNNIHLPDILETPGYVGATRYENQQPGEGQAKFIALYEIETDDLDAFMKANGENMAKKQAAGRFTDLLVFVSQALYKETYSVKA